MFSKNITCNAKIPKKMFADIPTIFATLNVYA